MRWTALILAGLALASNVRPSETIQVIQLPPSPCIGQTAVLHLEDAQFPFRCDWFRGNETDRSRQILITEANQVTARGPAYTGREDLWRECSLLIRNVQASDSGPYTVSVLELGGHELITAVGHLQLSCLAVASTFPPLETIQIGQFPPSPQLGNAIFLFLDNARTPTACDWFRGGNQSEKSHIFHGVLNATEGDHRINRTGPAYTGRESLRRGCSLSLQSVQAPDVGPYSASFWGLGGSDPVTGVRNLQVPYSPSSFHPEATRMVLFPPNPKVGQSVFLYLDNIEKPKCSWFRGQDRREEGLIFRAKFNQSMGDYSIVERGAAFKARLAVWSACSLVIRNVGASDSGNYTVSMEEEGDSPPTTSGRELQVSF